MLRSDRAHQPALRVRDAIVLWGPVVAWMAAIFYVSSQNTWTVFPGPPGIQALRKSAHIFEYAVLALLLGRALLGTATVRGEAITRALDVKVWRVGVAIAALYAVTDEIHQSFVPRREFHVEDIAIDALSATAALGIMYIGRTRSRQRKSHPHTLEQN